MGVDYQASFGVGVKILIPEKIDDEYEYLEELCENMPVEVGYFSTGQGNYTGEQNDFYICISEPFIMGEFQKVKADLFIGYLNSRNIKYESGLDCVGGLLVH